MNQKASPKKTGKKDAMGRTPHDHEERIAALSEQVQKLTEIAARAQADLQNYKQRLERDAEGIRQFASTAALLKILPVFDDLRRLQDHLDAPEGLREGFRKLRGKLDTVLGEFGVRRMNPLDEPFDPHRHEALSVGPGEKDLVIGIFEDGYELDGKVLRVAKVRVGDGTGGPPPQSPASE